MKHSKLEQIKDIILDDDNYQTLELKLGGIWDICDRHAIYKRRSNSLEVIPK